jgi:hypothetical protein
MIRKEHYTEMERKYGQWSSWAVWADAGEKPKSNIGDTSIFDLRSNPEILKQLNQNIVMVGLNFSREIKKGNFVNFHDERSAAQDYKIRYAFSKTKYYGAYMTDVIKGFEQKIAREVVSYLKKHRKFEEENIALFKQELFDLKSIDPLLIAFGNDTFNILDRYFKGKYRLIKIPHYSMHISKEEYKKEVAKLLN